MMHVNEIEFAFVFVKLLRLTMHLDLCYVVLTNKTQHGNQACLKLQRVKSGALEVGRYECSGKTLRDVLNGFMSREWAQTLGKICQDLIETCGKNIECVDAAHR